MTFYDELIAVRNAGNKKYAKNTSLAKRIVAALAEVSLIANDDGCNDSYRGEVAAEIIITDILNLENARPQECCPDMREEGK